MLQLLNLTPYPAERAVQIDASGNHVWVVVVKATFQLFPSGEVQLHAEQEPVCKINEFFGDPGLSSLRREAELVPSHPGTEVTILGSAWASDGQSVQVLDVSAQIGDLSKTLRVFGDRFWTVSGDSALMSDCAYFRTVPLLYEYAFGGTLQDAGGSVTAYPQNPIGRGFAENAGHLDLQPLPNLEDPDHPIVDWNTRPQPCSFGPIPPAWSPRKEFAGTFDQRWTEERMPVWPEDFNSRFYVAAPPGLASETPLRGGELVYLKNLSLWGDLRFQLPRLHFSFDTETRSRRVSHRAQLDRIILEPDLLKLVMVWRTALSCGTDARQIRRTVIDTKTILR